MDLSKKYKAQELKIKRIFKKRSLLDGRNNKMKYFIDYASSDITNIYFSYSPIVDIYTSPSINFNSGCWDNSYETSNVDARTYLEKGNNIFTDSTSLRHVFNFDNFNVKNKIKMVLGNKKIFITNKKITYNFAWWSGTSSMLEKVKENLNPPQKDDLKPRVILVLDPITFCSE
jgi:hypothetical protein